MKTKDLVGRQIRLKYDIRTHGGTVFKAGEILTVTALTKSGTTRARERKLICDADDGRRLMIWARASYFTLVRKTKAQ